MDIEKYRAKGDKFQLKDHSTKDSGDYKSKDDAVGDMQKNIARLTELQDKLYASNNYSLLIIIQAMDAAGKDGAIKHVMSGINPQGTQVMSFKQPSDEDMDHDYLWRIVKNLPERGRIGIFNRSHYEDVLVVRVHNLVPGSQVPAEFVKGNIWEERFEDIKNFETYLRRNGIIPLKFFLNVSKEEQKKRFLERIKDPAKNWKFSAGDVRERAHWNDYMAAYEDAIRHTSTSSAPWYIIPADNKWYARYLISEIIVETLEKLDLKYPELDDQAKAELEQARQILLNEGS